MIGEHSTKRLLEIAPGGARRATAECLQAARDVLDVAMARAVDQKAVAPDLAKVVARVAAEALRAYPADRSCATCDHESLDPSPGITGSWCSIWNDCIPPEARERGCERHQATGVPF